MQKITTRPLYLLARDALVQRIVTGAWGPGFSLPNEHDLAAELGISVGTVRKALDHLEEERIILRKQGRGTFVADHSSSELAIRFSNIRDPYGNHIHGLIGWSEWSQGGATPEEAARLRIPDDSKVLRVNRVRTYHNHAFAWDACVLPAATFSALPADLGKYRITALAQANRVLLSKAEETVRADLASARDAELLSVVVGKPILVLDRVVLTNAGRVVEWRVARCNLQEKRYIAETG